MNIIFMGPPGAGKGTQSDMVIEKYDIPHIATGDMFRAAIKNETEMGLKAKSFMDDGKLVPDFVTNGIVEERLKLDDTKKGFLLDGYPRTINQAEELEKMLANDNRKIDIVINIDVAIDVLIERLISRRMCKACNASYHLQFKPPLKDGICDKCGGELYQRNDDNLESATTRLEVYQNETKPLIEFFEKRNLLVNINGLQSVEEVSNDILKALEGLK